MFDESLKWLASKLSITSHCDSLPTPDMVTPPKRHDGGKMMAHRPSIMQGLSSTTPARASGLARLSASGIYQFLGSGGEKITIINKEKLRTSTAGVSSKGKK